MKVFSRRLVIMAGAVAVGIALIAALGWWYFAPQKPDAPVSTCVFIRVDWISRAIGTDTTSAEESKGGSYWKASGCRWKADNGAKLYVMIANVGRDHGRSAEQVVDRMIPTEIYGPVERTSIGDGGVIRRGESDSYAWIRSGHRLIYADITLVPNASLPPDSLRATHAVEELLKSIVASLGTTE